MRETGVSPVRCHLGLESPCPLPQAAGFHSQCPGIWLSNWRYPALTKVNSNIKTTKTQEGTLGIHDGLQIGELGKGQLKDRGEEFLGMIHPRLSLPFPVGGVSQECVGMFL